MNRPERYMKHPHTHFQLAELDGPVAYLSCVALFGPKAGQVVKFTIDSDDAERLAAQDYRGIALWCIIKTTYQDNSVGAYYLHVRTKGSSSGPYHRLVTNATKGKIVDHINGITEDNRKSNLRLVTTAENVTHRTRIARNNKSGVHGVKIFSRTKKGIKYQAYISVNKKQICFPATFSLAEAAATRRAAELEHYGKFAPNTQLIRDDIDLEKK